MLQIDFKSPPIVFAAIAVFGLIVSLPTQVSGKILFILIISVVLYFWYTDNELPGTKLRQSNTKGSRKKNNLKYLRADHQYRTIITQAKSLYRFCPPTFDTMMSLINQFIKVIRTSPIDIERVNFLKEKILNNAASIICCVPPEDQTGQNTLRALQANLESLTNFDITQCSRIKSRECRHFKPSSNIKLVSADDTHCPSYSPHFSLYR